MELCTFCLKYKEVQTTNDLLILDNNNCKSLYLCCLSCSDRPHGQTRMFLQNNVKGTWETMTDWRMELFYGNMWMFVFVRLSSNTKTSDLRIHNDVFFTPSYYVRSTLKMLPADVYRRILKLIKVLRFSQFYSRDLWFWLFITFKASLKRFKRVFKKVFSFFEVFAFKPTSGSKF